MRYKHSAQLAAAAYLDKKSAEAVAAKLGFPGRYLVKRGEAAALIVWDDQDIIVSFCGTNSLSDVFTDLRFKKTNFRGTRVHKGFKKHFDLIWPSINRALNSLPRKKVIYVGHSLGGSMAQLAAASRPASAAITFGSPRVGNDKFCVLAARTPGVHYEAQHDMVTGIPFRWGLVQFLTAVFWWRKPTMFRQPWKIVDVDSYGHSMAGYLKASSP